MKTVMVFGTFDILHAGHIHMFKEAKRYGDRLVVCVARDKNTEIIKGYAPFHSETERKELLENLKITDKVRLGDITEIYKPIREENPDIIALGYDQKIFADNLAGTISKFGYDIKIVRLSAYKPERHKSINLRKYMERIV